MPSRGNAISAYNQAFARGAKIYGANIQSGVVTSAHIANGTVVAGEIGAGAVTSAKLGAKAVVLSKLRAAQITGTIISSGITYAVNHGLSAIPALIVTAIRGTLAHISAKATVGESSASARTSAKFYIVGQPHGVKYAAYVQI